MTAVASGESDLHRRIALLEDKWADVEKGGGSASMKGTSDNGGYSIIPHLARIANSQQLLGNQYRIANPGPLGLFAFGYTTFILQGFNTRWTEAGTDNWAYAYGLFFGGLVQLLAGQWELYRNNVFGGTAFSSYGGFWMGFGILGILANGGVFQGPSDYPRGTQMALVLWGILTFIFFLCTLIINIGLMVLFLSLAITFFLLGAGQDPSHPKCGKAGGYFGVFTAAVAWYIATAELINEVYRRPLLPLGVVSIATKEPSLTGVDRPDTL